MLKPISQVSQKKERKNKKSAGGFYIRRSCLYVFSLQTGMIISVVCDLFLMMSASLFTSLNRGDILRIENALIENPNTPY
jgi:hypothetical protein